MKRDAVSSEIHKAVTFPRSKLTSVNLLYYIDNCNNLIKNNRDIYNERAEIRALQPIGNITTRVLQIVGNDSF